MYTTPNTTKIKCQNSADDQRQVLREHFNLFYLILAESQLVPNAVFETIQGNIRRCLSGIPDPYLNAIIGCPKNSDWDACIREQLSYFNQEKMPFVWYLNEDSSAEFKKKLVDYGFQDGGIFQGVIGTLDNSIPKPEIPSDCVLELVKDEATMDAFNELVCTTFGMQKSDSMQGSDRELFKRFLWNAAKALNPTMFHWVAKKNGKIVSALSTLIAGDMVSFWNAASLPEIRRQGFSTALCCLALKDAISKGCQIGSSYLMSDGMAFGIFSRLGYQTKWRFNVFISK